MINEERTKMMTRLALYESGDGKKQLQITKYFSGDYVTAQMIVSFLCGTLAFVIIFVLWAIYNIEDLMLDIFSMDILNFARNILITYIVYIAAYLAVCYSYLSYKYSTYKKRVHGYLLQLKELYRHYVNTGN